MEDVFIKLAQNEPDKLLLILKEATLNASELTFAAEIAGQYLPSEHVVPELIKLCTHASSIVREGAVYGLACHQSDDIDLFLEKMLETESSTGVCQAIKDILN